MSNTLQTLQALQNVCDSPALGERRKNHAFFSHAVSCLLFFLYKKTHSNFYIYIKKRILARSLLPVNPQRERERARARERAREKEREREGGREGERELQAQRERLPGSRYQRCAEKSEGCVDQ